MATRRVTPEDWNPASISAKSTIRASIEPRDERIQIPKTRERIALRPKSLNFQVTKDPRQSPPEVKAPPPSRKESSESQCENLRDPEVVDSAPSETWSRRDSPAVRKGRVASPSTASQYSTRQSEVSLGIIDYYMRDRSPSLHSPELHPTPKFDPAIEKFDFGLPPTPTHSVATQKANGDAVTGAEKRDDQPLIPVSPPTRPSASTNNSYRLFPVIKQVTPPPRQPTIISPLPIREVTPPTSSYRPRKESLTSSFRSRNDSLISGPKQPLSHTKRIPPSRIISTESTNTSSRRTTSTTSTFKQYSCTSPEILKSRWLDDTITSPIMAPRPGPRTSFGSLLRRDSESRTGQYPACFFEDDDDEEVPLRRRFGTWRKTGSSTASSSYVSGSQSSRKGGFWRTVMCGCGGR